MVVRHLAGCVHRHLFKGNGAAAAQANAKAEQNRQKIAEMNKVEVYKALLQAEQTKAQINQSLVARYKAKAKAR